MPLEPLERLEPPHPSADRPLPTFFTLLPCLLFSFLAVRPSAAVGASLPYESQRWLDEQEWAMTNLQGLEGRVLIDGEVYDPVCTCTVPPPEHSQDCYPRAVKITRKPDLPGTLAPGRLVLDGVNLRRLVGDPADLRSPDPWEQGVCRGDFGGRRRPSPAAEDGTAGIGSDPG